MTRDELLARLVRLPKMTSNDFAAEDGKDRDDDVWADTPDPSEAHERADKALLDFIGDQEISDAFLGMERWYE